MNALSRSWKPSLVESYMKSLDGRALPRTELQLPYASTPNGLGLETNTRMKLTTPRGLDLTGTPQDGSLPFKCFGKILAVSGSCITCFARIERRPVTPWGNFGACRGRFWRVAIQSFCRRS